MDTFRYSTSVDGQTSSYTSLTDPESSLYDSKWRQSVLFSAQPRLRVPSISELHDNDQLPQQHFDGISIIRESVDVLFNTLRTITTGLGRRKCGCEHLSTNVYGAFYLPRPCYGGIIACMITQIPLSIWASVWLSQGISNRKRSYVSLKIKHKLCWLGRILPYPFGFCKATSCTSVCTLNVCNAVPAIV